MKKTLSSLFLISFFSSIWGQEVILPLEVNTVQAAEYSLNQAQMNNKAARDRWIDVDLTKSNIIIVDDFSTNKGTIGANYWQDNYVYVNNNFGHDPQSIGVVTFDGLDETGYPYNFTQSSSYGACDTLTSLPILLGNVNYHNPDTMVYLSFLFQPQGKNPFANSDKDSIVLEFKNFKNKIEEQKIWVKDTTSGDSAVVITYKNVDASEWSQVWQRDGSKVHEFRKVVLKVDSFYYKNGFQFRFVSYGNTSGSVDHWHIDNVYMSVEPEAAHLGFNDVAYTRETGSQLTDFEAMPWSHYYDDPDYYDDDTRMSLRLYNSYNSSVIVTLEYFAEDASGNPVDSITGVPGGVVLFGKDFKNETMPITGVGEHNFLFPITSEPDRNATTYFLKKNVMTNPDQNEIIKENNVVKEYQVFGTYYSYDDGSAEAGYGIRANNGKLAYQFTLKDGMADSILAMYIYFNPVVVNRSTERFKLTIWADDGGEPGNIIYQNSTVHAPTYPKNGVNTFQRIDMDRPVLVSGIYYIGYEKLTTEVINIGYDVNRDASDKIFFNIGNGWVNSATGGSSSVPDGAIMLRPSFSNAEEPQVGIIKPKTQPTEFDVNLYPNPTSNLIYFQSDLSGEAELEVRIFNLQGSLINSLTMNERAEVDVSQMNPGLYVVRFTDRANNRILNKKFIVSR